MGLHVYAHKAVSQWVISEAASSTGPEGHGSFTAQHQQTVVEVLAVYGLKTQIITELMGSDVVEEDVQKASGLGGDGEEVVEEEEEEVGEEEEVEVKEQNVLIEEIRRGVSIRGTFIRSFWLPIGWFWLAEGGGAECAKVCVKGGPLSSAAVQPGVWAEEDGITQEEVQPSPLWSEERCEELWDRVEGVRHKLTRILNPAKLTPYLRQCKVIDEQDEDEVLNSTQYPLRISKADEEGPEGLTQFLLLEVRKLREQLRNSRMCERRLSQRCRMAEDERSRAERKAQDLRQDRLQQERLRQDLESATRELGKLKDRHLEQAVKYSRALEEQGKASNRERELLRQVEELRSRLMEAEKFNTSGNTTSVKRNSLISNGANGCTPALPEKPLHYTEVKKENKGTQMTDSVPASGVIALMDILQQDRRESAEQRQELCDIITKLQGEVQSTEEQRDKLESQCEQLRLKVRTLQLDWETEQKRGVSYFNQIMEVEKERDQALQSRDSLQLEYTDCLLDKNRLRKRIAELQANLEQQQRELERERERSREQMEQSSPCLHCSHLSLCSEDQCYGPCCSLGLDVRPQANSTRLLLRKTPSGGQTNDNSGDSRSNSEENLLLSTEDNEKEINRLSTFPFPPCMNSINRRHNTDPPISPKQSRVSLADDITIVGGNRTGIFVSHVKPGSPAEQCGLKEGSELLELERVLFGGGSVSLAQCTAEVAHFSLQWWTEPSTLKHQSNPEAYSKLCTELSAPAFMGADSFYVRVNLNMEPHGDPLSLSVSCDDIIHVTDTRYNGKYQWRCSLVDPRTTKPLQAGTMPNYNRAQQLLLIRLRKMALEQKDFKKKFLKKSPGRVRLVKAVDPVSRGIGSTQHVLYTLSKRHEEHLIPYSVVQPVQVQTKRPVIFSPSLLSRGLIERLLQPAESGLKFNTCPPEPIQASERRDKRVFLLDSCSPEQALGIRLQSIQDVISQDKHCLLELGLPSVEGLLRQGIYPIVIHIHPKNKKHKKLRKFFPRCGEDTIMEEVCQAEELQLETLPLLYYTLEPSTWSCTDELLAAIRNAIHSQQRAAAWVELDRLQ
ncbi:Caspase recruitment domain-containing protein 10 CARD-containing MAGUK protein 3 [Collichthys lucidus]|uniref:Caspase recruitment domain-containing protein 10 CARD-containing MAGUK protein 3 n=1 Tax=Collichthys lucidus TaxID=240159 RepID=A0A4U5VSR4_COLLU|nr:Caspase recruitment domain-containing protein 10 CARD-containing MAGUK protein 3 [Collichthys lucidus]